ncbi:hypothetical protein AVEN_103543-1 [Araneus ventricosus]|uniref:Uncharacterized protein n=1 Tax=Araneus ventricosus TaxID=182803 RepID=A0A4Y2NQV9_ARAVE|nr:hypothetical protein AVEN_103543-1 [Araneus ventricosus]
MFASIQNLVTIIGFWQTAKFSECPFFAQAFLLLRMPMEFNKCPPAHSRYRSEGPGATIHFKGDRKDQTALARLSSVHLKALRFSRGDKKFNICTKFNMIEATPQHLLDCVALVYDDLLKRQDFVLEVMKANDLMDLI